MKRLVSCGLVLGSMAFGALGRAEDKQETLKATVVEPYSEKGKDSGKGEPGKGAADAVANPSSTVCTNGKNRRLVELTAGDQAAKKPCEVHYKKETEQPGHDQLIWSTASNMDSCATKAKEFLGKLATWGWTCGK